MLSNDRILQEETKCLFFRVFYWVKKFKILSWQPNYIIEGGIFNIEPLSENVKIVILIFHLEIKLKPK